MHVRILNLLDYHGRRPMAVNGQFTPSRIQRRVVRRPDGEWSGPMDENLTFEELPTTDMSYSLGYTVLVNQGIRGFGTVETIGVKTTVFYFTIWSIWSQLSFLYRLYWLLLSLVGLYTLFSASIVRGFPISNHRNDATESSRIWLEARIANLRQIISAMSFAFGALFF
jgi:hypothetical protein